MSYHLPALYGFESLDADITDVKGIVVFGSRSSVHERLPWQMKLESHLKKLLEKKTPTLGICYGHQMLAYMFGGKVVYHHPEKETAQGFRKIKLFPDPLWENREITGEMAIKHNEIVSECPPDMKIIGTSDQFQIDALAHKTLPIWSFQPHPEAVPGQFAESGMSRLEFGHSIMKRFFDYVKGDKK